MNGEIERLLNLGRMDLEAGYSEYARAYFEKVFALDPNNREATEALAEIDEILSGKAPLEPTKPQVELTEQEARPPEQRFEGPPRLDTAVAKPTKKRHRWWLWGLVGIVGLVGCSIVTCLGISIFIPSRKETPTPIAAIPERVEPSLTAEAIMGEFVVYEDVETTVVEYELTDSYVNTNSRDVKPEEGAKFLWLHVRCENVGEVAHDLPSSSQFVLLYRGTEITPGVAWLFWGRQGYQTYHSAKVYPGVVRDGWILYQIPLRTYPAEILVRFEATGGLFTEQYHIWSLR